MNCYNMLQMIDIHCRIVRFIAPEIGFTMLAEGKLSLFLINGIFFIITSYLILHLLLYYWYFVLHTTFPLNFFIIPPTLQ